MRAESALRTPCAGAPRVALPFPHINNIKMHASPQRVCGGRQDDGRPAERPAWTASPRPRKNPPSGPEGGRGMIFKCGRTRPRDEPAVQILSGEIFFQGRPVFRIFLGRSGFRTTLQPPAWPVGSKQSCTAHQIARVSGRQTGDPFSQGWLSGPHPGAKTLRTRTASDIYTAQDAMAVAGEGIDTSGAGMQTSRTPLAWPA
jgi:hypothetical protein